MTPAGERLDARVDEALEPLRRLRAVRAIFGAASTVGDFSILWHAVGLARSIGSADRLAEAVFLSCALRVESLVVNQGIKRFFRRTRPTVSGDDRFSVRRPSTSSFPSGHASSATCAAILLASFTGAPLSWLWGALAVIVATSRVVVRIHHFTDIVAGALTGAVLGAVAVAVSGAVLG